MRVSLSYMGHSQLRSLAGGKRLLELAPNLSRDKVAFDATLTEPLRFREAISVLHDVVINDLTFAPRDKSTYEAWKAQQTQNESQVRQQAVAAAQQMVLAGQQPRPTAEQSQQHKSALHRYWKARSQLNTRLQQDNPTLWRRLLPYDPVMTVADDVLFFECFSTDESSYGCLTVDRDSSFASHQSAQPGTTNVDYSWDLYHNFQALRTYRETRFLINPEGFSVHTSDCPSYHEEKIDLPDGWLRGFMQLQAAMALPMKKMSLTPSAVYSVLTWLKRHREKGGPRAIRFELQNGQTPRIVLEPWEISIDSPGTTYQGAATEPVRIWGRRRLLSLARVLPLASRVDVYLTGSGLPSFWVVQMGNMRLTLGLSGWTTNDWTRGSAVQMLLPPVSPQENQVALAAELLSLHRTMSLSQLSTQLKCSSAIAAAAMNQLALRGQAIFDLHANVFRWRQVLPMELSDREFGPPHPETAAALQFVTSGAVKVDSVADAPRGGLIILGKIANQSCEVLIDSDGVVRKGKCRCGWHFKSGIRNGPCRHLQALRNRIWMAPNEYVPPTTSASNGQNEWYSSRVSWSQ